MGSVDDFSCSDGRQIPISLICEYIRIRMNSLDAGCYSWSKGAELKPLQALAAKPGWDLIENVVEVKSCPTEADEAALREVGAEMARRIRAD